MSTSRCSIVVFIVLVGVLPAFAQSDDNFVYDEEFSITGNELEVRIDIDGAELRVEPNTSNDKCGVYLRYYKENFSSEVDYDPEDNQLDIILDQRGLKFWKDGGGDFSRAAEVVISLPTEPLIYLFTKIKAGEVDMELGGLRLVDFELRNWAGEITVNFDEPNPIQMEYFEVNVKAGEVELRNLGNANFEEADINSGIGELTIDFSGNAIEKALVRIDLDVGETNVIIPEEFGVKLKVSKFLFLSGVDLPRQLKRQGRYYYTDNYKTALNSLYLRITPGIGELQVEID